VTFYEARELRKSITDVYDPRYVSLGDMGAHLGVAASTVLRWERRGGCETPFAEAAYVAAVKKLTKIRADNWKEMGGAA